MDIENIKEEGTQRVAIEWDDEGEPTAGFIIVSKNSDEYQKTSAKHRQRQMRRQSVKKTRFDLKTEEGAQELDSTLQENQLELAQAVAVDWFGFNNRGTPLPFDKNMSNMFIAQKPVWRDRILASLEDEASFLKNSPVNSLSSPPQQPEQGK
jgi:hypothetical protein